MSDVLILGACGFTGRAMIEHLRALGVAGRGRIVGVDLRACEPVGGVDVIEADLTDGARVRSLLREVRPAIILNFAGVFGSDDLPALIRANALAPAQLLQAIVDCGLAVQRVLLVGSAAEYGIPTRLPVAEDAPLAPITAYGISKAMQSELARFYHRRRGIPIVIARTFNLLGSGLSESLSLGAFQKRIREARPGGSIRVGNVESKRDFISVGEAVEHYWRLAMRGEPGEAYNVCSGTPTRIADILQRMIRESGKELRIEVDPKLLQADDVPEIYGDNRKLRALERRT